MESQIKEQQLDLFAIEPPATVGEPTNTDFALLLLGTKRYREEVADLESILL